MAGDKKSAAYNTFLAAIVMGVITCAAFTIILVSIGFQATTAFPLAYTLALSVFSAFLFKIYRITTKEPQAVERPAYRQLFDGPSTQHCLILAERTHGALQDRVNYWLSGNYGIVKGSTVTASEKGVFMTIFYEATGTLESPSIQEGGTITELPAMRIDIVVDKSFALPLSEVFRGFLARGDLESEFKSAAVFSIITGLLFGIAIMIAGLVSNATWLIAIGIMVILLGFLAGNSLILRISRQL